MRRLAWRAASAARRPHRRRAPAWASGGNGARYVALGRRMRRMTSGTSTSECSGCLFCPAQRPGKNPGEQRNREEGRGAGLFWETRTTGCVPGTGVRGRGQRAQAVDPPRTGVFKHRSNVAGVRIASRSAPGAENGKEASGRIGAGGSGGRWVSQAGDSVLRVPYGPGCVWPVGSQGVDGSDRHAGAARGRNRGSGSKALGMISPVG